MYTYRTLGRSLIVASVLLRGVTLQAQRGVATADPITSAANTGLDTLLRRSVTVNFDGVPVRQAIDVLAQRSGVEFVYQPKMVDRTTKRVTLHLVKVSLANALDQVLAETSLRYVALPGVRIGLIESRNTIASNTSLVAAVITGTVRDIATHRPLSRVTVSVENTPLSAITDSGGRYHLAGVEAGSHTLVARKIAYEPQRRTVDIPDSGRVSADFELKGKVTSLDEVVTTATGTVERIKVGNDIVRIDVQEVLRNAPVTNMSELLTSRVPGLIVQKTSGAPGAPSVLRIRGTSSINLNNDPIIIVDGARIYSSVSDAKDSDGSSPLDGIDPNSVESVEVMRGPSAAALYGTDAANGVIVVKSKRGSSGPTRWHASTQQGTTSLPSHYPLFYTRTGADVSGYPRPCATAGELDANLPVCKLTDSLVVFQLLNDRRTTLFGRGSLQEYSLGADGGNAALQFAFTLSSYSEEGYLKLPDSEVDRIVRITGDQVPRWQRRPTGAKRENGTSRIAVRLNDRADLQLTSSINRQTSNTTPLANAITSYLSSPSASDSNITVTRVPDYRTRTTTSRVTSRFALSGEWRPHPIATMVGDLGWEQTNRNDRSVLRRDDCPGCTDTRRTGTYMGSTGTDGVMVANERTTFQLLDWRSISGPTTLGFNYTLRENEGVNISATSLAVGGSSFVGAENILTTGNTSDQRVAGFFVDQRLAVVVLGKPLYTGFGLRFDRGSGLGTRSATPQFPKLDFSIPIITNEEPWHQVSLFRIRTAYGHAGIQPGITSRLRTFTTQLTPLAANVPGLTISTIGNTLLRPERSVEYEGGWDLGVWSNRLEVGVTGYRKFTQDLLITVDLPPSVYGGLQQQRNIGDVVNYGGNATLAARLIETPNVSWMLDGNLSANRNRLVTFNEDMKGSIGNGVRSSGGGGGEILNVKGYPLNGYWTRPLISYADANGDGFLGADEIRLADSAVYLGDISPKFDASLGTSVGLLRGRVNVTTRLNYQHGMLQINRASKIGEAYRYTEVLNDPLSPLRARAEILSGMASITRVSSLRWDELSIGTVVSPRVARLLRAGSLSVAVQGRNLHLWSNYSGIDPNVRSRASEVVGDNGQLPPPTSWLLRVDVGR